MNFLESFTTLFEAALRVSPPIILAAMAALLSFKIKMMNIAIEGFMLIGAFTAVMTSYFSSNAFIGVVSACIIGGLLGFLFALFNLTYKADHIITGIAVNLLALGLSTYLLRTIIGVRGAFSDQGIIGIPQLKLDFLESIPVLSAFSNQGVLVYVSIFIVILVHIFLYRTPWGTYVQAIGDYEPAARTAGIPVLRIKYLVLVFGGVMAGLGGAHLSLGQLTLFTENMTNGRGFIAIAATVFGQRTPIGSFFAALFFSFADAFSIRLQKFDVPVFFIQSIPFILTLVILVIIALQEKIHKARIEHQNIQRYDVVEKEIEGEA